MGVAIGCRSMKPEPATAPLGTFMDDYGEVHVVTPEQWHHQPSLRYHIEQWSSKGLYLVARNDSGNGSAGGLFTRIDWMPLDMPPYTWAFCLSAYDAPTFEVALRTEVADRSQPREGCNGFPFTRLRPVPDSTQAQGGPYDAPSQ
ncbi:MAG: hypothetical protein RhofKO_32500 [Rhodothermales bacterium]